MHFIGLMTENNLSDKWFVVVNIYAASKKAGEKWEKAKKLLQKKGVAFDYSLSGAAGNVRTITLEACNRGVRRFIAVGGDGTVHDVLNAILLFSESNGVQFSDFTLGVIPMGSGNDWIKTLGISKNINKAVDVIVSSKISRQDIVKVTCADGVSYVANVAGVGIDARVCDIVNRKKKMGERGKILYVKALIMAIRSRKPSLIKVICDGRKVFEGDYLSIAFGVGRYSGGGMLQTPEAVLDDGLLDMTLIPDLPLSRIAVEVHKLFTGRFLTVPELVVSKSRCIEVIPSSPSGDLVEVDGEVVGRAPVRFDVLPGYINILVR